MMLNYSYKFHSFGQNLQKFEQEVEMVAKSNCCRMVKGQDDPNRKLTIKRAEFLNLNNIML